jgi:hypothetical protein
MRLIKFDVFWRCILSQYLTLRDITIFDTAVNNLEIRKALGLPLAKTQSTECHNTETKTLTAYESNLFLNQNHSIRIANESMLLWSNRKRIKLPNISFESSLNCRWDNDIFNPVKILSFYNFQPELDSYQFTTRFNSLTEVTFNRININILNNLIR